MTGKGELMDGMIPLTPIWIPASSRNENVYAAFRATVGVERAKWPLTIRAAASSQYRFYMNGKEVLFGPSRSAGNRMELDEFLVDRQEAGGDTLYLTAVVTSFGVVTRFTAEDSVPFLAVQVFDGQEIPVGLEWLSKELTAYKHLNKRLNAQLGWAESCDTQELGDLYAPDIQEGDGWQKPGAVDVGLNFVKKTIPNLVQLRGSVHKTADGTFASRFGYDDDHPVVQFVMRDLAPQLPPQGRWYRFDCHKIGLYRPMINLTIPPGTKVEAGYSESLLDDRVYPVIHLSASESTHLDRWIAKGGRQTLQTFSPRGFRYLELYITGDPREIELHSVNVLQTTAIDRIRASLTCSDARLNQIWQLCVDTLQSCTEDAITDSPTRERGQWVGDAVLVGLETMSVVTGDLSIIRRTLVQATASLGEHGFVAGHYPAQYAYIPSFALLWLSGCLRYYELTGDIHLLQEAHEAACTTIDTMMGMVQERGLYVPQYWNFVDWGCLVEPSEIDVALNMLLLRALRDMAEWETLLGRDAESAIRLGQAEQLTKTMQQFARCDGGLFGKGVARTGEVTASPGYHATVLALDLGLVERDNVSQAIRFIKEHMMKSFPNDVQAPRLANPSANHDQLITPYFAHFALQTLLDRGEDLFVLQQYRQCWGWMLDQGATTLLEVFDPRWSHCHAWSGSPAWQSTRYFSGLHPVGVFSSSVTTYAFKLLAGDLEHAELTFVDVASGGLVHIAWRREGAVIPYKLECERPLRIKPADGRWSIVEAEIDEKGPTAWSINEERLVQRNLALQLLEKETE
ncbi:MAG: hypothetical protein J7639_31600 [Paenibacillaceae bacterium]|nr:hypothetical protein [Paenibacillaceae bacterium]